MGYKIAQIEELQKKLDSLPEVDDVEREITKQEAVRRMADSIAALQSRGYSMEKIAEIMTTEGMEISVQTLKSYLTRAKRPSRAKPRRKKAAKSAPSLTPQGAKSQTPSSGSAAQPAKDKNDGSSSVARSSSFEPRRDSADI